MISFYIFLIIFIKKAEKSNIITTYGKLLYNNKEGENMEIYLSKVKDEEKEVLYRLLQYSLFEESENDLNEMNQEAIYEYKYFDSYFIDNDRYAFFIREKETNKILGFAMVNTYVQVFENGHSIAEFMVIPKYRKNHIGKKVAFELFDRYRGNWEVSPSYNSCSALFFWNKVVKDYTGSNYKFENDLFLFNNEK